MHNYPAIFSQYPSDRLIGMEIGGTHQDQLPVSMRLWDDVLSHFAPTRPFWGFASSDIHGVRSVAPGRATFLTELLALQNSPNNINDCIVNGKSFCYRRWSASPSHTRPNPSIRDIIVNRAKKTITVDVAPDSSGYPPHEIKWISYGKVISDEWTIDLEKSNAQKYVRFEITSFTSAGHENRFTQLFSQPFMIQRR